MAVISDSPWVHREIEAAQSLGVPVLPVRSGEGSNDPGSLEGLEGLQVIDAAGAEASAGEVSRSVHDLFRTKRRF